MKTIHLVFNAHIDPIWQWPWQAGVDEAIATCRSACDRLDNHPDLTFTRGEAWVYSMVEEVAPLLFERIRGHVLSGRWEITGGWWIQPDCNAPSGWAWDKQIEIGLDYFQSRFGIAPKVGYNVDSFGHAATIPARLQSHGQTSYVMMRPGPPRLTLPARIFRWRGYDDSPEVTTFRLASYCARELDMNHIKDSLTDIPEGIDDTMCFLGLGDHGGGPTEEQIAWLREHWDDLPGVKLIFSSPSRFFDTIADKIDRLPIVTGELQSYAIGCYTIHREIKTAVRRAEHIVHQAESMLAGSSMAIDPALLERSWRNIAFAQFHDILAGTCTPSSYRQITDQLGFASSVADDALQMALRKKVLALGSSRRQRIVAWNASEMPHNGFLEFEPWLEYRAWNDDWRLYDENGALVPYQHVAAETLGEQPEPCRLLFPADLPPGALRVFEIDETAGQPNAMIDNPEIGIDSLFTQISWMPQPRLDLVVDETNPWSSPSTESYSEEAVATAIWDAPQMVDTGPLMVSAISNGHISESRLSAEWRLYAGQPYLDLRLRVHWLEKFKVLKMVLPWVAEETRVDGISGGCFMRSNNGKELPLRDWTLLPGRSNKLGIVCPDIYALDADRDHVRLTLLRSSIMTWRQHRCKDDVPRAVISDQGFHDFRFRFYVGADVSAETLDIAAIAIQRPPLLADITVGMNPGLATGNK